MRATERKGAWGLLIGIVILRFILWIFGKCQGSGDSFSADENGNPGVEMRTMPADSAQKYQTDKKRKSGNKKTADKKKTRARKSKRKIPVRDILADTIATR